MAYLLAAVWMLVLAILPRYADAETLPTAGIIGETIAGAPACLNWFTSGLCFWMTCTIYGCSFDTSIRVFHYNPDVVVGVFNAVGENPWTEIAGVFGGAEMGFVNSLVASAAGILPGGGVDMTEGTNAEDHKNLKYRETDVIGHPVPDAGGIPFAQNASGGLLCPSAADAFHPYLLSAADAIGWRLGLPDMLLPPSYIPGVREIGTWPVNTWGGVYPRSGWVVQTDEAKGAAVLAQRAGDIVTRGNQGHIYNRIPTSASGNGMLVWPPGELKEGDPLTGKFQMLLPVPEPLCRVFGTNDLAGPNSWGGGKQAIGGDFMWVLWRPYRCCKIKGTTFLGAIGF